MLWRLKALWKYYCNYMKNEAIISVITVCKASKLQRHLRGCTILISGYMNLPLSILIMWLAMPLNIIKQNIKKKEKTLIFMHLHLEFYCIWLSYLTDVSHKSLFHFLISVFWSTLSWYTRWLYTLVICSMIYWRLCLILNW